MAIQRYSLGIKVEQADELKQGFRTGIVRAKYYDPDSMNINGEAIEINIIDCSPTYEHTDKTTDCMIVLNHTKVVIQHQNNDK